VSGLHAERIGDAKSGIYAVFVETVEPPGAAEMSAMLAADFRPARLGADGIEGVERVMVDEFAKDGFAANERGGVESDAVTFAGWERLQAIHVVGHGDGTVAVAGVQVEQVIPGGTGDLAFGEQGFVGVEDDFVFGGAEVGEDGALGIGGRFEEREDLIAVGGEDDVVEALIGAGVGEAESDAVEVARHGANFGVGDDAIAERFGDWRDVGGAAAGDGFPLGVIVDGEEAMVLEKADQRGGGKIVDGGGSAGPDGGGHGEKIEFAKFGGEIVLVEKIGERAVGGVGMFEECGGYFVEAANFGEEPIGFGAEEILRLGEIAAEAAAGIFVAGFAAGNGEGHVGIGAGDLEFGEQADEVGVSPVVVNDETGVDGKWAGGSVDGDGVGVAAEAFGFFEKVDLVAARKIVGGSETGDA